MSKRPWYSPFVQSLRAGAYLTVHLAIALAIVGSIYVVDHVITGLGDMKLFDVCPLRYAFDAIDLAVLSVFGVFGSLEAIDVFRDE